MGLHKWYLRGNPTCGCVLLAMTLLGDPAGTVPRKARGALGRAFRASSASECVGELGGVAERFVAFGEVAPRAIRGEWSAVAFLVGLWQDLVDDILQLASGDLPELVQRSDDSFAVRLVSGEFSVEPTRHLVRMVVDAPVSPFVAAFGPTFGFGVHAINAARSILPGCSMYALDPSPGWPALSADADVETFGRLVGCALRRLQPPLVRVKDLFGVNSGEVAAIFGVSRQAVDQWEASGNVPALRRSKLANLLSVGELLDRKLAPGRLPLVARRPAAAYGGITMLEMLADDRDSELLDLTRRAFGWSTTP